MEHWNILQKSGQIILKTAFKKKILTVFQHLNAKIWLYFFKTKLKSLMLNKTTISRK